MKNPFHVFIQRLIIPQQKGWIALTDAYSLNQKIQLHTPHHLESLHHKVFSNMRYQADLYFLWKFNTSFTKAATTLRRSTIGVPTFNKSTFRCDTTVQLLHVSKSIALNCLSSLGLLSIMLTLYASTWRFVAYKCTLGITSASLYGNEAARRCHLIWHQWPLYLLPLWSLLPFDTMLPTAKSSVGCTQTTGRCWISSPPGR